MTLTDYLAQVKARTEAASPGPWHISGRGYTIFDADRRFITEGYVGDDVVAEDGQDWEDAVLAAEHRAEEDADFIANARQDIPRLLAIIEELKGAHIYNVATLQHIPSCDTWTCEVDCPARPSKEALTRADQIAGGS